MQVIPTRTFLLRQEEVAGGKKKDVYAKKGEKMDLKESEVAKFFGGFELTEQQKKTVTRYANQNGIKRVI